MDRISADVSAELIAQTPRSPEDLEQTMLSLLDTIEADAADIAIGPVVACNFEDSSVDVQFCVEAGSSAEVHQKISRVAGIIEGISQDTLQTSMAPSSQHDLAGTC